MLRGFVLATLATSPLAGHCTDADRDALEELDVAVVRAAGKKCGNVASARGNGGVFVFSHCFTKELGISQPCAMCYAAAALGGASMCADACSEGWCQPNCVSCTQPFQDSLDICTGLPREPVRSLSEVCIASGSSIVGDWDLTNCAPTTPMSTDVAWDDGDSRCVNVTDIYPDAQDGQILQVNVYPVHSKPLKAAQLMFRFVPKAGSADVDCSVAGRCAWTDEHRAVNFWMWSGATLTLVVFLVLVRLVLCRLHRKPLEVTQSDSTAVSLQPF